MSLRKIAAIAIASLCLAGAAHAAPVHKDGMTIAEVRAWLTEQGYTVEQAKGDSGDAYLKTEAEGVSFDVQFYDCKNERCTSIQLTAGFDMEGKAVTADSANAWNLAKRYVDCYVDEAGDPWFTYDINVSPGATSEALDDNFAVWIGFLPDIKAHIGWE